MHIFVTIDDSNVFVFEALFHEAFRSECRTDCLVLEEGGQSELELRKMFVRVPCLNLLHAKHLNMFRAKKQLEVVLSQ